MDVLVLNIDYSYLGTISWKRATTLLFEGLAEPAMPFKVKKQDIPKLENTLNKIHVGKENLKYKIVNGVKHNIIVPNVIRILKYVRATFKTHVPFSKRNVFIRDSYTCQYCEKRVTLNTGDLEHMLPRSRGGKNTWDNCVTSCKECNLKKGDKTPHEACMPTLHFKYFQPTISEWMNGGITNSGALELLKSLGLRN